MILVGQLHRLQFTVRDASGVATAPSTATLTVTAPDGTGSPLTVTPGNPTVYDYLPTQAGRHQVAWASTGPTARAVDVFNVDSAATGAVQLVGMAEAKAHLDMVGTTEDAELRRMIVTASQLVEAETQLWHRETVVETLEPTSGSLLLSKAPVVSVTSVVQGGVSAPAAAYYVHDSRLHAEFGYRPWSARRSGVGSVTVTYEAGTNVVPSVVRDAVLVTLAHLWESQRGAATNMLIGSDGADQLPSITYALPYAAQKMLEPWAPPPGVA